MTKQLNVISLGAGVQSSTMALMAAHGEIEPMPDCAIFADTQAEPQAVYDWLDWLTFRLPFPVEIVTQGNLERDSLRRRVSKNGKRYVSTQAPLWFYDQSGKLGPGIRKCTRDYKVNPIIRKIKELAGIDGRLPKKPVVRSWIGISRDEAIRIRPSRVSYIENIWPLIDLGMTRRDCLAWMREHNYPEPPRSACVFCPYHSDAEWQRLKETDPAGWARAVQFEKDTQAAFAEHDETAQGMPYLWQHGTALEEADFTNSDQLDLFGNECEGMCGV